MKNSWFKNRIRILYMEAKHKYSFYLLFIPLFLIIVYLFIDYL